MSRTLESPDITSPLLPSYGEGIEFISTGFRDETFGPAVTVLCPSNFDAEGLRKCTMEVSSWVGVSIGANHHYVRLTFYGCKFTKPDGAPHERSYTYPNGMPEEAQTTEVEVRRPVTQRDIDYAKKRKDGWIPHPGDTERGFWTELDAYDAGIRCFKEKFAPGWVLMSHNNEGRLVEIART